MPEPEKTIAVKESTRTKLRRIKKLTGCNIKRLIADWADQELHNLSLSPRTNSRTTRSSRAASSKPRPVTQNGAGDLTSSGPSPVNAATAAA